MKTALPVTKHAKIVYLLDHWEEIHDPDAISPQGSPGDGTSTPHLPRMSHHPSVVELTRCLAVLKLEHSLWHDHLKAWHGGEWRIHTRISTRKRRGGRTERVEHRDRHRHTPGWVKAGYVRNGEFELVRLFQGPVFIPGELWDALTLSTGEIEAKRLRQRPNVRVAS